ncbi:MAG TPA: M56 family metallopeptidase, partial [Gemmatimonadaceae bacterium]|nr:M56 family metallopeptidase [Gemmatimonadaceae bacterium]
AIAIWAGVAMLILASLAWSAFLVRRIVRRATPLEADDWSVPLWEIADRLGLDEAPRLLRSADGKMPFACGVVNATIVLPSDCDGWSLDRRRAVLLHELAHVRRHDLLGHTLGRIACAVWWFHPLVWAAAKELRAESERACDDLALSCGTRATDYAEHLLDIVTAVRRDATPQVALAMARRKEFEGRMLAILDPQLERVGPGRLQSAALAGSLVVIALLVGAAAPVPRSAEAMAAEPQQQWTATGEGETGIDSLGMLEKKQKVNKEQKKQREQTISERVSQIVSRFDGSQASAQAQAEAQAEVQAEVRSQPAPRPQLDAGSSISAEGLRAMVLSGKQGRAQGTDDRPALLARVLRTDKSAELRRVAAWGLGEYGETQVGTEALAYALRNDDDAKVREMAAWALGESGADGSVAAEALSAALRNDSDARVRGISAWAIGEAGVRGASDALVAALADNSADVRKRAIWAFGESGSRQAPQRLIEMLKDREPEVREITAWALYEIEDVDAAPALQAALNVEQDKDLQIAYIRALAVLGDKSVDAIRGLLESSDPKIKSMAVRALAGGDAAGPWPWPWPEPRPYP